MFLMNSWYAAGWPNELDANSGVVTRRILDRPILMFRSAAGNPVAFLDRCPHRLVPLSAGRRIGDQIRCGYHGMVFGESGQCVHIPGQEKIPPNAAATTFPLVEQHGILWIWLGDTKAADPDLIPFVPWPALPNWAASPGYTHVAADYRLLTDNLLDLSHENYIHQGTIGNDEEETIADFPVQTSVTESRVVRAHREMPDIAPPPFFRILTGSDGRIDRWQTAIWTAPSINMTDVGARPCGAAADQTFVSRILHLLTPETETSTHYFWCHNRNFRQDDAELTARVIEAHQKTFDEDREMCELQQRELTETGLTVPQMALRVDDAPLRARRILASLIRDEKEGAATVLPKMQSLIPDPEALQPVLA